MDPREAGRVELFERALMEAPTALSFIGERLAELAEDARPTPEERDDLSRRMWAALSPPNGKVDEESWFIVTQTNEAGTETVRFMLPRASAQARVWPRVFREWQLERVPGLAARAVLNTANAANDNRATLPAAEGELTRAIRDALPGLLAAVGDPPADDANARVMGWLKARPLAKGTNIAAKAEAAIRDWPAEKWADPWTAARFIGGAVWPKVRDNLPRHTRPGFPSEVLTNLTGLRSLQLDADLSKRRSLNKGSPVTTWVASREGPPVVGLDVSSLDDSLVDPSILRGLTAQRLLRFVMHRGHDQYVETGGDIDRATKVKVRGGWRGLAKEMGEGAGDKAVAKARETARALQAAWMKTHTGGEGGLLMVHHEPRGPGQPFEEVTITLNEKGPLSPMFAVRELHGRSPKIVPVPLPSLMPPMVGRNNEHGAIATLQLLVLRELRLKAKQLVEQGGVAIPMKRWEELAKESGVPIPLLSDLLKAWCIGDQKNGVPAFITRAGDMVNLAPAYEKERLFIEDGGKLSLTGQRRGRAAKRLQGGTK